MSSPAPIWCATPGRPATSTRCTTTRSWPRPPACRASSVTGCSPPGLLASALTDYVGEGTLTRYAVRFTKQAWPGDVLQHQDRDHRGETATTVDLSCDLVTDKGVTVISGEASAAAAVARNGQGGADMAATRPHRTQDARVRHHRRARPGGPLRRGRARRPARSTRRRPAADEAGFAARPGAADLHLRRRLLGRARRGPAASPTRRPPTSAPCWPSCARTAACCCTGSRSSATTRRCSSGMRLHSSGVVEDVRSRRARAARR